MAAYLDHNATSPLRPELLALMQGVYSAPLNPSSVHTAGRAAKKLLEDARKTLADFISVFPNEIIFTSGGTEANNLAVRGFAGRPQFVSSIEHASIFKTAAGATLLPVCGHGLVKLDMLEQLLKGSEKPFVSVMLASNETGVIQPIADIARITHAAGGLLHVDGVQALGKIDMDMGLLGADMLSLSAHKLGGPVGVGALVLRQNIALLAQLTGGGQELGRRAGTENIAAITAFAALTQCGFDRKNITHLRDEMEAKLVQSGAVVLGGGAARLCNTSLLAMPFVPAETQLMAFDLAGVALSAGSACSSGRVEVSHVLKAMEIEPKLAASAVRVSLGWNTQQAEISHFIGEWKKMQARLGAKSGEQAA